MLQELTHMDRITQLQDEIQNVCGHDSLLHDVIHLTKCISKALDDNGEQHKLSYHQGKLYPSQLTSSNYKAAEPR